MQYNLKTVPVWTFYFYNKKSAEEKEFIYWINVKNKNHLNYRNMSKINKINKIQSIYDSIIMQQILFALSEGKKDNSELSKITGRSASTISQLIRILKNSQFVEKEDYGFYLTSIGKILAYNIKKSNMTFDVMNKFKDFWTNHFLEGIPDFLLDDIGELYHTELVKDTSSESSKTLHNYFKLLRKAKQVFVVSSMTSIDLCNAVIERLNKRIPVEVIITEDVMETLSGEPFMKLYHDLIQFPNLKLMVTQENAKIAITITDYFISFGLYKKAGTSYDFSEDIVGVDAKSINWGMKVFQYYKDKSVVQK